MYGRHHVFAVDNDRCSAGRAQGNVQDGAVLCDVDLFALEHGVNRAAQPGFFRQLHEEVERFVRDAVLGVIEVDAGRFAGQPLAALGIIGKQLAQVQILDLGVMRSQGNPAGTFFQR